MDQKQDKQDRDGPETEQTGQGWTRNRANRTGMDQKQNKQDRDGPETEQTGQGWTRNRTNRTGMAVTQPEQKMVSGVPQKD